MWLSTHKHTITGITRKQFLRLFIHLGHSENPLFPSSLKGQAGIGKQESIHIQPRMAEMVDMADYHLTLSTPHTSYTWKTELQTVKPGIYDGKYAKKICSYYRFPFKYVDGSQG